MSLHKYGSQLKKWLGILQYSQSDWRQRRDQAVLSCCCVLGRERCRAPGRSGKPSAAYYYGARVAADVVKSSVTSARDFARKGQYQEQSSPSWFQQSCCRLVGQKLAKSRCGPNLLSKKIRRWSCRLEYCRRESCCASLQNLKLMAQGLLYPAGFPFSIDLGVIRFRRPSNV